VFFSGPTAETIVPIELQMKDLLEEERQRDQIANLIQA